jgi:hypothetical protein
MKEVMTKFTVSTRSDLETEEVANGRSDAPMDVAMKMAKAPISCGMETVDKHVLELMEGNENAKRRRRSDAPAALNNWKTRIERTIPQHAQELT